MWITPRLWSLSLPVSDSESWREQQRVCVCVVCAVRVHTRAMCRGEGKLGCRSGMSPRRGVEEGHAQIKKSRKQLCQAAVPEQTVQLIS